MRHKGAVRKERHADKKHKNTAQEGDIDMNNTATVMAIGKGRRGDYYEHEQMLNVPQYYIQCLGL